MLKFRGNKQQAIEAQIELELCLYSNFYGIEENILEIQTNNNGLEQQIAALPIEGFVQERYKLMEYFMKFKEDWQFP